MRTGVIRCMSGGELGETNKKSAETVAQTRCDARRQISEMEEKVYAEADKAEYTRRAIRQQAAEILSEKKNNVEEVRRLASRKISHNMAEMEENNSEVRRFTCQKIADKE